MRFAGSQFSMSDWVKLREKERKRYGLDYINNPHARGKCWICHWRPVVYAPESAREYAIWRRRKIPLLCGRSKCHERLERETVCDYCGRWARFDLSREYDRWLLDRYDVIRCYDCEKVSFDEEYEYYKCELCGWESTDVRDFCVMYDPFADHEYDSICKRQCRAVIRDRFERKYFTFDEI